jgi:hypothetical protein
MLQPHKPNIFSPLANGALPLLINVMAGTSLASCTPSAKSPTRGDIIVQVVDANGAPLEDVEVEGLVDVNEGIVASTCCVRKRFDAETTAENGSATLTGKPFTYRASYVRASYRDWPPREVLATATPGYGNGVRVVLGPKRRVRGRVELGADCPLSDAIEVFASTRTGAQKSPPTAHSLSIAWRPGPFSRFTPAVVKFTSSSRRARNSPWFSHCRGRNRDSGIRFEDRSSRSRVT